MRSLIGFGTMLIVAMSVCWLPAALGADPSEPAATAGAPAEPAAKATAPAEAATTAGAPAEPATKANAPTECKVFCVSPHAACKESEKVLVVLQTLVKAINNSDWKTYADNLDDHCSTFDESSHKLISGKESVVADLKQKAEKCAREGVPLLSVTIDQPYAQVTGDTAVVTFLGILQFGGKHPFKEESHATDVFVKCGDTWKKCHFRGVWKRV